MKAVELPRHCSYHALITTLVERGAFSSEWKKLSLKVGKGCHVTVGAIAFLCTWGLELQRNGRSITFVGYGGTLQYLARMNLFRVLGIDYKENFTRHAAVGRFISLYLIDSDKAVKPAVDAIADLVIHQFENARDFLPALEWSVNEVVDNIRIHSETPVPGAVCAQYFPKKYRLEVGVCDMGKGVKASLEESFELFSHGDAVTKALERGVTRNASVGQGNGLAGSLAIARANEGVFRLWTGDCIYSSTDGDGSFRLFPAEIPGTGVSLSMNTTRPVRLSTLFIGDSDWGYMDVECERIESEDGLRVTDECDHVGGREPARRLRYKIMNLLPDYDGSFPLDFTGVERPSSSFLDELLGRLALRLGESEFRRRIRIVNVTPEIESMANVVIHQRLEYGSE